MEGLRENGLDIPDLFLFLAETCVHQRFLLKTILKI
jgi:hypothetical protein